MTLAAVACQAGISDLPADYDELLNLVDAVIRACRNPKISAHYFRMFVSLIDTYPQLLAVIGQQLEIEVGLVRKNAGNMPEKTGERFFKDLSTIGVIEYTSPFDKSVGHRRSFVTPQPDFTYVETFDTSSVDRKRKAKEAEEKRRNQFRDPRQLFECENCHSTNLVYDATAHCKSCGHVHAPITDIPAADLIIPAEVHEIADGEDWLNSWDTPTIQVKAIRPGAIQASLPETPIPPSLAPYPVGQHPRGKACPDCHSLRHWQARPTDYGTLIYVCAVCYPE